MKISNEITVKLLLINMCSARVWFRYSLVILSTMIKQLLSKKVYSKQLKWHLIIRVSFRFMHNIGNLHNTNLLLILIISWKDSFTIS